VNQRARLVIGYALAVAAFGGMLNATTVVLRAKGGEAHAISLHRVTPTLADKAREIMRECGSVVVSAVSPRGNRSNHPIGRAVDLRGNPKCIYVKLKGWPGGVSTDYASAPGGPHVHVSYNPGGQEWGLRFAHRRAPQRARYAHRNHTHEVVW
jgi:hypothetical protein